jgi:mitofilin
LTAEWNSVVDANLKTQHLVVAVEAVKSALETQATPKPFVTELAALKEIAADDPVVSAAIASINPAAYQRGIPSPALLIDRFRRVASEVRKAALLPEDAGVASHIASLAMSKVLFKKSGLALGQDVEAVLARTEVLLEEGDLDAAAREMNGLQGWAKVLSKDWLGECRRVLEVRQALDVIATEARLNSLLVE